MTQEQIRIAKERGEAFENFVRTVLFPEAYYDLMHHTSSHRENNKRFNHSSRLPDFKFRCKVTLREFWVEAKFRSKAFNNRYQILSAQQKEGFPEIAEKEDVFVALGFGGLANDPAYVSLIAYKANMNAEISPEFALSNKIEKKHCSIEQINKFFEEVPEVQAPVKQEEATIKTDYSKTESKPKKIKRILIAIAALLLICFGLFSILKEDKNETIALAPEVELKENIVNYYQYVNQGEFDKIVDYLDNRVSFYGSKLMTSSQIITTAKANIKLTPFAQSIIDPETIKIIPQSDGDFYVTYDMVYKLKKKRSDTYKQFDLKMITYWNEDLKLTSISEIRK